MGQIYRRIQLLRYVVVVVLVLVTVVAAISTLMLSSFVKIARSAALENDSKQDRYVYIN